MYVIRRNKIGLCKIVLLSAYHIAPNTILIHHSGLITEQSFHETSLALNHALETDCMSVLIDLTDSMCPDEWLCLEYAIKHLDPIVKSLYLEQVVFILDQYHPLREKICAYLRANDARHKLLFATCLEDAILATAECKNRIQASLMP